MTTIKKKLKRVKKKILSQNIIRSDLRDGINKSENREKRIIVSLTTTPMRIASVSEAIESIMKQTVKPDKIILWLTHEEFEDNIKVIPKKVFRLQKYGLQIKWCENLKPHTKYFAAMKTYPDDLVLTIDDDIIYSKTIIEDLYESYKQYPNAVIAKRGHLITFKENGEYNSYNDWIIEYKEQRNTPLMGVLATGVGGVLYPPGLLHEEWQNKEAFTETSLFNDDIWLKIMEVMNNIPVVLAGEPVKLKYIANTGNTGLFHANVGENRNDVIWNQLIEKYNEFHGKDDTLYNRIRKKV